MQVVVPLAGPDFIQSDDTLKPLTDLNGTPLLKAVLESRAWYAEIPFSNYTFIFRDDVASRQFVDTYLENWFPGARHAFLSAYTQGAALTAAVGVSMCAEKAPGPLILDLADILYDWPADLVKLFGDEPNTGALALYFESQSEAYSYIKTDAQGHFVAAAEKHVISSNASAGTYVFSDAACYLAAVSHSLRNAGSQTHNGLHYVCPLFNGVHAQGLDVKLHQVSNVFDVKIHA